MKSDDRSWPINSWYVCAVSAELLPGSVIARVICGEPMVIFRNRKGHLGALLDRCPHRLFPLSEGSVTDRGLQCAYHGMTFGIYGECSYIPSQELIPANAGARAFPVSEAHGLIWVWPGEASRAGHVPLPTFETGQGYLAGLDFSCNVPSEDWGVAGPHRIHIKANYLLAVDNLLDLTHTAFVHAETFDNSGVLDSERIIKTIGPQQLTDFFGFKNSMSAALRSGYMLDDAVQVFDNFLETYWQSPSVMILVHGAVPEGRDRESDGAIVLNTNIITPETETSCHYFWAQSVYRNRGNGQVRSQWERMTEAAFAEDEAILSKQQANLDRFGSIRVQEGTSLVLQADKAITLARRLVSRQICDEAAA